MTECPSVLELTTMSLTDDASLRAHVADCVRCTALLAVWSRQVTDHELGDLPSIDAPAVRARPAELDIAPAAGAVHAVLGEGVDRQLVGVVVEVGDEQATVLPISAEVCLAGDWDALLDDLIGYPAMAEVWNHLTVLREQIGERLALLPDGLVSRLDAAYDAALRSGGWPEGLPDGPAVAGPDDPRIGFRREEALRTVPYGSSWRRIADAPTFAAAVASRRAELEESLQEVAAAADVELEVLGELERGYLDLRQAMPVPALGVIVGHLGLPPSARLYRLVEEHVFANDRVPEPGQPAAFARRRRGSASKAGPAPPDETRRRHAQDYVARLRERLES